MVIQVLSGATALLPAISQEIRDLGWYFIPLVLLSSALAFGVALLSNNIQRRYPTFWFTAPNTTAPVSTPPLVDPRAESSHGTTREGSFVAEVELSKYDITSVVQV